ncbi:MAG: hypothetical protein M3P06_20205 [Acidobacteriota bacterium]|nr:hypothetical protein [Acidobacteriota bacterium]
MKQFEEELAKISAEFRAAQAKSHQSDVSDALRVTDVMNLQTRCLAAVERATGKSSVYFKKVSDPHQKPTHEWNRLAAQIGVVESLLHDIRHGFVLSLQELVHGELFGDFLEMADHLLESHYKDAAAVIAGSTLEGHLRQLASKAGVPVDQNGRPKKADLLNSELASADTYSKLDQKNVTAWLGLRNDAAHGNYGAYDENQVRLLIQSIRHFITVHPA